MDRRILVKVSKISLIGPIRLFYTLGLFSTFLCSIFVYFDILYLCVLPCIQMLRYFATQRVRGGVLVPREARDAKAALARSLRQPRQPLQRIDISPIQEVMSPLQRAIQGLALLFVHWSIQRVFLTGPIRIQRLWPVLFCYLDASSIAFSPWVDCQKFCSTCHIELDNQLESNQFNQSIDRTEYTQHWRQRIWKTHRLR